MYFGEKANIQISSPQSVVLYNRGANIFSFATGNASNPNIINIETQMLRLWNIAKSPLNEAGGFDNPPTTEYYKADFEDNLTLNIQASSSQLLTTDNNLISDDTGYPITTSTLKLLTSNVIAMGKLSLDIDELNDKSTVINGITNSSANIQVKYLTETKTTTADTYGSFTLNLDSTLEIGTSIKVSANTQFLTKWLIRLVNGSVSITNLPDLKFNFFTTKPNLDLVMRQKADWSLEITDTRVEGDNWYLYAYISKPLSSSENNLDNVLIYKKNNLDYVLSQTPLLVYTGTRNNSTQITNVTWENIEGFLIKLEKNKTYLSGSYQTEIFWQVTTELL